MKYLVRNALCGRQKTCRNDSYDIIKTLLITSLAFLLVKSFLIYTFTRYLDRTCYNMEDFYNHSFQEKFLAYLGSNKFLHKAFLHPQLTMILSQVLVVVASVGITAWLIYNIVVQANIWRVSWKQVVVSLILRNMQSRIRSHSQGTAYRICCFIFSGNRNQAQSSMY